jgi:hypothetical protein
LVDPLEQGCLPLAAPLEVVLDRGLRHGPGEESLDPKLNVCDPKISFSFRKNLDDGVADRAELALRVRPRQR